MNMVKKLRVRFIAVSMSAVAAVLICIMLIINIASYVNIVNDSDKTVSYITENDGRFPKPIKIPGEFNNGGYRVNSPEAPYETRFFTVIVSENNEVISVNTGAIAAVDRTDAGNLARSVLESGKNSGFSGNYRYGVTAYGEGKMIVFLDCSRDLSVFASFLKNSVFVCAAGMLAIFALVMIFAGVAVRPIAQAYEKQKRFISDASHELKTPLTVIGADTELIELEHGSTEWTESIRNQVARLSEMTNGLVTLSRMDEGAKLIKAEFSLTDAVRETAEQFTPSVLASGKKLTVDIQDGITYTGDEKAIRGLVSVICDNAVKYSEENGEISVSLRSARSTELCVRNTVSDMSAGAHNEMFERFYRGDASRTSETGGFGSGLSIAKATVTAHGGKITDYCRDGKTLEIRVIF